VLGRLEVKSRQTEVVLLVMLGNPHQKQQEALVALIEVPQLVMELSGLVAVVQQVQTLTMVQQTRQ
tara:strand:+ start:218 stop:415 length:198 start_codon:yes stop_codon:yes gene_type:complete